MSLHAIAPDAAHAHAPYEPVFPPGSVMRGRLDELLTRYPSKQAALLPALWMLQEARGWVPPEGIEEVAAALEITPAYVRGVVTFYTMYHQHPVGTHFVQVCTTSPCGVCGAEDVVQAFLRATKCEELGVTSPDGRFTVVEVECLGACGFATPVMINDELVECVSADSVQDLVAGLD